MPPLLQILSSVLTKTDPESPRSSHPAPFLSIVLSQLGPLFLALKFISSTVSSFPQPTSDKGVEPWRTARKFDKGVCARSTLALPQCEFATPHPALLFEMAGKLVSPLDLDLAPRVASATTSWSTSARLAAGLCAATTTKPIEELVPHQFH
jgi:hypothetical protein